MREFGMLRPYEYNNERNYLKNLDVAMKYFRKEHEINYTFLMIMLFCYDLEFWTADHVADKMGRSSKKVKELFIYPAMNRDLVYKHFDRLSPKRMSHEEHLFYEETKMSYRVRYALTQKARLLIQQFYKMLEG